MSDAHVAGVMMTERLRLRPFVARDAPRFAELAGTSRIAEAMISIPHPMSLDIARAQIAGYQDECASQRSVTFAITLRHRTDQCIGSVALRHIDRDHDQGELSFWIAESEEGYGYVTEAAQAALEYAFQPLQLNRVCAYHLARNGASGRVLARLGMEQEGRLRGRVRKSGAYHDVLLWALLKAEWRQAHSRNGVLCSRFDICRSGGRHHQEESS
jgi:[ribosomal protein S5]-alanine N-acetyltransferase